MRVLLVGNGAREHAIGEAVVRSGGELYSFMSARNPGLAKISKEFAIGNIHNPEEVSKWAAGRNIDVAIPSPDAVLAAGVSDALVASGVPCAGPVKQAARIEWDKSFARNLMREAKIPGCPKFGIFENAKEAAKFIDELGEVAVKPAGLTGGKGVKVTGYQLKDASEAKKYAKEILESKMGGIPSVIIEEKLIGEEFTLQAFVDGKNVIGMPAVQDHKRAGIGDVGPNTGGMGSYSDSNHLLPFIARSDYEEGIKIMKKTVSALAKKGADYRGFLYGQFMAGKKGVKAVEFNSRLGDPEAMNVLAIFNGNFVEAVEGVANGKLSAKASAISFERKATVCKYLVPAGYPENPRKNEKIELDEKKIVGVGARLYYASVDERDGIIYTGSSRSAGVLGIADSIEEAEKIAEKAIGFAKGPLFHRKDIGTKQLIIKRIEHMKQLRRSGGS
ncbi:MAG: phosphoribosylamine--glycine ligase [Candidatus Micrarchaeota archaeon]|nr:phosphoribosylamine--glycine ligase [Candidatus Micrarchaeota archaeon]